MTIPSLARIPTQVPALLMASIAYSTCNEQHRIKEICELLGCTNETRNIDSRIPCPAGIQCQDILFHSIPSLMDKNFAVIRTYLMKTAFGRKGGGRGIVTAGHIVFVLELQRDEVIPTTTTRRSVEVSTCCCWMPRSKAPPVARPSSSADAKGCRAKISQSSYPSPFFGRTGTD
jgi:hypothetical protein